MATFEDLKKGISDVSETIAKKACEVVSVQKLKMKKSSLESDIRKDFVALGKLYFEKMGESGVIDDDALEYYQKITEAQESLEEIKAKIEKMSGEKVCKSCGNKTTLDTVYCPKCGTKFEEAETEETESEETSKTDAEESCGCETEDCGCEAEKECSSETEKSCDCEAEKSQDAAEETKAEDTTEEKVKETEDEEQQVQ